MTRLASIIIECGSAASADLHSIRMLDSRRMSKGFRTLFPMQSSFETFSKSVLAMCRFLGYCVDYICCMYISRSAEEPQGYESPAELAATTAFSVSEVEALYELFKKISCSVIDDGLIHKEELQLALFQNSKRESLFADRVFDVFDFKRNGVIEFGEFVRALSIFHPNTDMCEKIDFAFKMYDLRSTGFIEREEVKMMLDAIMMESDMKLTDEMVEIILDKTFADADIKKDDKLDIDEWRQFASRNPTLMKTMTLPYLKDITTSFPSFVLNPEFEDAPV